jgi:hypothetical protein
MANNNTTKKPNKIGVLTIDKKMRDYSKDPTVQKRAKEASAFLKKVGLPDRLIKKFNRKD